MEINDYKHRCDKLNLINYLRVMVYVYIALIKFAAIYIGRYVSGSFNILNTKCVLRRGVN